MTYKKMTYNEWIKNPIKIFCKCPCNGEIIIKKHHKQYGIPEYIKGHQNRVYLIAESYEKWIENETPKMFCECGCYQEIIIKEHHKKYGIPKYIRGHHSHSEETKQKMIKNSGMKGKQHTENTKQKMRDNHRDISGDKNPFMLFEVREKVSGKNSCHWKGGISYLPYCEKFNEKKKEEIRNEYNRKCYICGKDEKDNKYKNDKQIKLSVHHVDNDKEQGCNGKSWKLVPLCIHCHNSKKRKDKYLLKE